MNSVVAFVILHYQAIEDTILCVESILEKQWKNVMVIVVDNNSPNGSGKLLQKQFQSTDRVICLIQKENLGFARGNNIGYKYAKEVLKAEYIVCINNDTIVDDENFIPKVQEIYNQYSVDVLGPDIWNPIFQIHQNPFRIKLLTHQELNKMYLRMIRNKGVIHIKRILEMIGIKSYTKSKQIMNSEKYDERKFDSIILHGSCIIFTPNYIKKEETAFSPVTYMYLEEYFLSKRCSDKGYKVAYFPDLHITHNEGRSTLAVTKSQYAKDLFTLNESIKSAKLLLSYYKNAD